MTQHPPPIPDLAQHPLGHAVVKASAGSGKTYRLTGRYLQLVAGGASPGSILATTFTRKAAGEILARVAGQLAAAVDDATVRANLQRALTAGGIDGVGELSPTHCLAMLKRLAGDLHRLNIATLDSFFQRVARTFAWELDLPPDPQIIDAAHPEAIDLRMDAIDAMLSEIAGDDTGQELASLIELMRQAHHDMAVRSVTTSLDRVVNDMTAAYQLAPDRRLWSQLQPIGLLDDNAIEQAIDALPTLEADLPLTKKGVPSKSWADALAKIVQAAHNRDWEAILTSTLAQAAWLGEGGTFYRKPVPGSFINLIKPLYTHARAEAISKLAKQTEATFDLLDRYHKAERQLLHERGVVRFDDITSQLASALRDADEAKLADVYFRLDAGVGHLLLDEFQDTSVQQWAVLEPIARQISADGNTCPVDGRSLFCVGDVKQAIYGWRGGVAALFDEVIGLSGIGPGNVESMTTSYRCSQVVLDAVNRVFTNLTNCDVLNNYGPAVTTWQGDFQPHAAARNLPGQVIVQTLHAEAHVDDDNQWETDGDDAGNDTADDQTAAGPTAYERNVARHVAQLHWQAPIASIGVLLRTRRMAKPLLFELRRMGIVASGEGGQPLTDTSAVVVIVSLLRLIDYPADEAAAFHVFNSPLSRTIELASTNKADVIAMAHRWQRRMLDEGIASAVAQWAGVLSPHCSARSSERLEQLVNLAHEYDQQQVDAASRLRPSRLAQLIETQPIEQPGGTPIRIMTVHASKGLEFDAVVLPELSRTFQTREQLIVKRAGDQPLGEISFVVRAGKKALRELEPKLAQAYDAQVNRKIIEELCGLYVAMTRPRFALHMLMPSRRKTKKGNPASRGRCPGSIIVDALAEREDAVEQSVTLHMSGTDGWHDAIETRDAPSGGSGDSVSDECGAPAEAECQALASLVSRPSRHGGRVTFQSPSAIVHAGDHTPDVPSDQAPRESWDQQRGESGRLLGLAVHSLFETISFADEPLPDDSDWLEVLGSEWPDLAVDLRAQAIAMVRSSLERPAVRQVLGRPPTHDGGQHVTLWREKPFAHRQAATLITGRFDRVVITRDDGPNGAITRAHLIDFKTDRIASDEPLAIQRIVARYEPQLQVYARAIAAVLQCDIDAVVASLLLVRPGQVVDVPIRG